MAAIVPTITTDNPAQFNTSLSSFMTFTKRVQIDFSDGTFAPTQLVPLSNVTVPDGARLDFHLMTARPSQYLPAVLEKKPALCIIHAEVNDDALSIMDQLKAAGIKAGLALLKTTLPRRVQSLIEKADHVMIFSGTLGSQGGKVDLLQIEKVPLIRAIKSDLEIGWDGGANLSNVRALAHAGIDVINVGSALSQASDPATMYQSLITESEKKGVLV